MKIDLKKYKKGIKVKIELGASGNPRLDMGQVDEGDGEFVEGFIDLIGIKEFRCVYSHNGSRGNWTFRFDDIDLPGFPILANIRPKCKLIDHGSHYTTEPIEDDDY